MSTISTEQAKDLRNTFECWQQDYDPVEDKEQYEMFGLGVVAMDELLALRKERERAEHPQSELSQRAQQILRDATALAATLSAETDTTSQQFESLAGKVVGGSEGFECTPVADLYELLTKCGECYDYTTSAKVAAAWIKDGYSAREYVKLDRLQEAMTQGSSGEPDGWIPCSERMPDEGGRYWCYVEEINSLGKSHYQWNCSWNGEDWGGEGFYGRVTHWQPLPEPPCK